MALNLGTGNDPEPQPMADINTTPLVDVLLVLLVMLIITIPIQLHAVSLEMPGLNAPQPATPPEVIELEVLPGGVTAWNGRRLADRAALDELLREAAAQANPPELHVRPARGAKYETVAQVLSSAQRSGLQKIGLVGSEQFR